MPPRGFLRGGVTGASERHGEAYGRGERTAQATNGDEMARGADVGEGGHRQVPSGDKKAPRACMHSGALLQHYTMRRGRPELLRVLAHLAASSSSGRAETHGLRQPALRNQGVHMAHADPQERGHFANTEERDLPVPLMFCRPRDLFLEASLDVLNGDPEPTTTAV